MFDVTLLILLGLAALGFVSHNTTVAVSILVLIIVRVTPLNTFFPGLKTGPDRRDYNSDHWRHGADRQRNATALHAHPLLCELEITGCYCRWGICLRLWRTRRYANG